MKPKDPLKSLEDNSPLSRLPPSFHFTSWLFLNVALTLLNKAVFSFGEFTFPYTLSAVHMLITGVMSYIFVYELKWFPANNTLDAEGKRTVYAFSFLFMINIVMGNLSIQYVPVSLVQIFRAIIPGVTMVLSYFILSQRPTFWCAISMIPICVGVMLTVKGEVDFTMLGLFYTAAGTFLSSLKVVVCNKFLVGAHQLNPLDLLARVSPLAFLQMLVMIYIFEWDRLLSSLDTLLDMQVLASVILSGFFAFMLNVTNFYTNQKTSPLTLTVGGNVKQVLTIVLSIVIFQNPVTFMSAMGMMVTTIGAIIYSYIKYRGM